MIKVQNVRKVFKSADRSDLVAVNQVDFEIGYGEIFGIIGYSGAGKSTLIRLLNGLEKPTEGEIFIADKNLCLLSEKGLRQTRQKIGMIFQHFNLLWSRTVRENIAFPLEIAGLNKSDILSRVNELIGLVGLSGKEDFYPAQLSGGQKQRVGIARALANNPEVLLCDEATSALDPETTDAILDLLVDINKRLGLTIVLITHEMHVIQKICHRVAVMESGKIVETGDVLTVFKKPQQQVTQRFVQQLSHQDEVKESLQHVIEQYPTGKIVHLKFVGDSAEKPLISKIVRDFNVEVNIIQGNIVRAATGAFGTLTVHFEGADAEISRVMEFIHQQEVGVEVENHAK